MKDSNWVCQDEITPDDGQDEPFGHVAERFGHILRLPGESDPVSGPFGFFGSFLTLADGRPEGRIVEVRGSPTLAVRSCR